MRARFSPTLLYCGHFARCALWPGNLSPALRPWCLSAPAGVSSFDRGYGVGSLAPALHRTSLESDMGKVLSTDAARPPQGDALAPLAGAAQPPLDLSLGHIGTSPQNGDEIDLVTFGPYIVTLDYPRMLASVELLEGNLPNRSDRRVQFRKVKRLLAVAARSGMAIHHGGDLA